MDDQSGSDFVETLIQTALQTIHACSLIIINPVVTYVLSVKYLTERHVVTQGVSHFKRAFEEKKSGGEVVMKYVGF